MNTTLPKISEIKREWLLVDAADKPLGRLAVGIANALRGKIKTTFAPHIDAGDFIVVINAEKVKLTGHKEDQKTYHRFSGYRDGLKVLPVALIRERHPERIVSLAVRGMMPKNNLCRRMLSRLKVYAGTDHPHAAQNPRPVDLMCK